MSDEIRLEEKIRMTDFKGKIYRIKERKREKLEELVEKIMDCI